jgi:hypothetical protein
MPFASANAVKLLQIAVADQMRPQTAVRGPAGLVDEDRHEPIL